MYSPQRKSLFPKVLGVGLERIAEDGEQIFSLGEYHTHSVKNFHFHFLL